MLRRKTSVFFLGRETETHWITEGHTWLKLDWLDHFISSLSCIMGGVWHGSFVAYFLFLFSSLLGTFFTILRLNETASPRDIDDEPRQLECWWGDLAGR